MTLHWIALIVSLSILGGLFLYWLLDTLTWHFGKVEIHFIWRP
jgi:hypothetical protein